MLVEVRTAEATATDTSKARKPVALLRLGCGIRKPILYFLLLWCIESAGYVSRDLFRESIRYRVKLLLQPLRYRLPSQNAIEQIKQF